MKRLEPIWWILFGAGGFVGALFRSAVGEYVVLGMIMVLLLFVAFLTKTEYFVERRMVLFLAWANSVILVSAFRVLVVRPIYLRFLRTAPAQTRLLVVGAGEAGSRAGSLDTAFDDEAVAPRLSGLGHER